MTNLHGQYCSWVGVKGLGNDDQVNLKYLKSLYLMLQCYQ